MNSTSTLFFKSYSFPYQNLIKLRMNQILDKLKLFHRDWSETEFLKGEATQYHKKNTKDQRPKAKTKDQDQIFT
ncbi:hypothetical protein PIROE2DRAFT_1960 [Piromyces sp. E2]|nr:hypothetical protein PIROE2DRAFT_1960 [Piromyces sp. E2]|eukprot:OUM70015.1 hypothetical protein PIROE2DRAFT_1960 [Piromyces sp. E2]